MSITKQCIDSSIYYLLAPESTATFVQQTNSGTRTATSTASSSAGASEEDDDDGGSNAGAIAGGVVGGVVGLAALGLLAFFLYRRNQRNQNNAKLNSPQNNGVHANLTGSTYGAGGGSVGGAQYEPVPYTPHAYEGGAMTSPPPMMGQKLYDPNDPSTFPTAASPPPVSMGSQTTSSAGNVSYVPSFPQPQTQTPPTNQGMYRGVAEV